MNPAHCPIPPEPSDPALWVFLGVIAGWLAYLVFDAMWPGE